MLFSSHMFGKRILSQRRKSASKRGGFNLCTNMVDGIDQQLVYCGIFVPFLWYMGLFFGRKRVHVGEGDFYTLLFWQ